jgi:Uma2 family endonuclease
MSIELLPPITRITIPEPEQWELEEPRTRRFSPVEFGAMMAARLVPSAVTLLDGRLRDERGQPFRWTVDDYYRLAEIGVLGPEERVELINGEILEMSPQKSYHATGIELASDALRDAFGRGFRVRLQLPLQNLPHNEPEPDVAVAPGSARDYRDHHPSGAVLVVEVSDTSLRYDLTEKANLYSSLHVPDYWVTDVRNARLHVFREPEPFAGNSYGARYTSVTVLGPDDEVSPLHKPQAKISVRDLLPYLPGED